jgi:hypothetical protein
MAEKYKARAPGLTWLEANVGDRTDAIRLSLGHWRRQRASKLVGCGLTLRIQALFFTT